MISLTRSAAFIQLSASLELAMFLGTHLLTCSIMYQAGSMQLTRTAHKWAEVGCASKCCSSMSSADPGSGPWFRPSKGQGSASQEGQCRSGSSAGHSNIMLIIMIGIMLVMMIVTVINIMIIMLNIILNIIVIN